MIATGMDGWSRGNLEADISLGYDLRSFIPLDKTAFELAGETLEEWCKIWMGNDYTQPLTPEGWYWEGHQSGVHVWSPPPAAALVALSEVAASRHKWPHSVTHVFLCQRLLFQEEWRRAFEKEVDVWFVLNLGDVWPNYCFEPLIVGIAFPMYRNYPWLLRQEQEKAVEIGRSLSGLSKTSHLSVGNYLRKLWLSPRTLQSV